MNLSNRFAVGNLIGTSLVFKNLTLGTLTNNALKIPSIGDNEYSVERSGSRIKVRYKTGVIEKGIVQIFEFEAKRAD